MSTHLHNNKSIDINISDRNFYGHNTDMRSTFCTFREECNILSHETANRQFIH